MTHAEAVTVYGHQIVSEVISVVEMSDPDGAHSMFEDMELFEHAECVADLYFKD